jgi:hypothetical protein
VPILWTVSLSSKSAHSWAIRGFKTKVYQTITSIYHKILSLLTALYHLKIPSHIIKIFQQLKGDQGS